MKLTSILLTTISVMGGADIVMNAYTRSFPLLFILAVLTLSYADILVLSRLWKHRRGISQQLRRVRMMSFPTTRSRHLSRKEPHDDA